MWQVLGLATSGSTDPDLRDRGYIYWRLLSSDPEKAKVVVLSEPGVGVAHDSERLDANLLENLLTQVRLEHTIHKSHTSTNHQSPSATNRQSPIANHLAAQMMVHMYTF